MQNINITTPGYLFQKGWQSEEYFGDLSTDQVLIALPPTPASKSTEILRVVIDSLQEGLGMLHMFARWLLHFPLGLNLFPSPPPLHVNMFKFINFIFVNIYILVKNKFIFV